jgi:hypothetical protein
MLSKVVLVLVKLLLIQVTKAVSLLKERVTTRLLQVLVGLGYSETFKGGSGQSDTITASGQNDALVGGSGLTQILTAKGMFSIITEGSGNDQTANANGSFETITMGSGTGDVANLNKTYDTVYDWAGTNPTIIANAGHQSVNLGSALGTETVNLNGYKDDLLNIAPLPMFDGQTNPTPVQINISGIDKTTEIDFGDTQANATITQHKATATTAAYTTVDFASGQNVTLTGIHDAVTFAGDPSIHYI